MPALETRATEGPTQSADINALLRVVIKLVKVGEVAKSRGNNNEVIRGEQRETLMLAQPFVHYLKTGRGSQFYC